MNKKHAEKVTVELVKLLKEKRLAKGLSHQKLSDLSGVSRTMISRIESNLRIPSITICAKIAGGLGENLADLIKKAEKI